MNKSLQNRIILANKYIAFAIKHNIHAEDYFGSTYPTVMSFTEKDYIKVSPTGKVVTIKWKDGYDMRPYSEKFYPNKFDGEEEIRYLITGIIRGIKKEAKAEGWTIGHKGQSFSARKANPHRRNSNAMVSCKFTRDQKETIEILLSMHYPQLRQFREDLSGIDLNANEFTPYTLNRLANLIEFIDEYDQIGQAEHRLLRKIIICLEGGRKRNDWIGSEPTQTKFQCFIRH